jgi:hypothetical protein
LFAVLLVPKLKKLNWGTEYNTKCTALLLTSKSKPLGQLLTANPSAVAGAPQSHGFLLYEHHKIVVRDEN